MDRRSVLWGAAGVMLGASVAGCGGGAEPPSGGASGKGAAGPGGRAAPAGLPAEVVSAATGRSEVALTFHGQGGPGQVEPLLRVLEAAGVGVTVLAVGTWLGAHPGMAGRVLAGGHELGNHSENHLDMNALDAEAVYREIAACAARLTALTGSPGRWFRPSQTQYANAVVKAQAARAGYPTCLAYSLDSRDNADPGADAVVRNVLDRVRPGDVVSLHFGHDGTTAAMPALLGGLRTRGLRPVTATRLFTP